MSLFPSRRDFMHVGFMGGLGLTLTDFLKMKSNADIKNYETKEGTAKSVIFIYLPGGMAHQESFDPKPFAPIEYRGPMKHIATKLPGVFFNENMKETAKIADKITVCRSMTHGEAAHERGTHNMFTGYRPSPALSFPSMGSVISHEFGPRTAIPPYVAIPNQPNEFAGTGYLSSSFAPFSVGSDPASANFTVRDLTLPGGVDDNRFTRRRSILDAVNDHFVSKEKADSLNAVDTFYKRAYGMVSSKEAREAFDINKEDAKLRDAYGRNQAGARMLLARRLVEGGARFITMTYGGWDMHNNIEQSMDGQMPSFDKAFATLISDLDQRGLLDTTMVCVASEFGRTPKINATAGRDHWPKVFSVVLAGGGFKRGSIYGSSNATASEPEVDALNVQDWATTIYHNLGIIADKELMAPGDRPIEIVDGGKVRQELLA
ncbi:MAG: DUF1501 domain-containing protein [Planctomycetaceae bacterium]|jgi:hypothetical protein|nr:DUF1501 domain-containing protein [Planctomycetaceae bacterium]MDC0274104.1 DUF1501 domain-containing protein [Planctomycetaceae bacterium]MDG2387728.1 DUF1501 domain-containing protein [Planctomycetaceae bacterium]